MTVTFYAYNLNQEMILTAEHLLNKSVRFFINWEGVKVKEHTKAHITWTVPTTQIIAVRIMRQFQARLYRVHEWNKDEVGIYDYEWTLGD